MPSQGPVVSSCEVASDHEDSAISIPSFDHTTEDNRAMRFDQTSSVVETEGNGECLTGHAPPEVFSPEHDKRLGTSCRRSSSLRGFVSHYFDNLFCHHFLLSTSPVQMGIGRVNRLDMAQYVWYADQEISKS